MLGEGLPGPEQPGAGLYAPDFTRLREESGECIALIKLEASRGRKFPHLGEIKLTSNQ